MYNPLRALADRRRAIAAAEQLYTQLLAARKSAGTAMGGVDLPNDTEGGVAILHHLLRLHPRASKQADGPAGPQLSSPKAQLP